MKYCLCNSLGKWVKHFPVVLKLSSLIEGHSCITNCLDVAQTSLLIAFPKEIFLHLSLFLYDLMAQCSPHVGGDLSQISENLLDFIKEFLVDGSSLQRKILLHDTSVGLGQLLGTLINAARKWSTLYSEGNGKDYTNAWTFIKELAQTKTTEVVHSAIAKIQYICKNTEELACTHVDKLTAEFSKKTDTIITAMSDICKNEKIFQISWFVSSKVTELLGWLLEFIETFFDYISSLTAFDFNDVPLEMGWVQIEANELAMLLINVGTLAVRRKRRFVGQH